MEIKGGTESRVEGALLMGDGEGDRRGKGLRKLHQSGKSTLLERGYSYPPDLSADPYNLFCHRWRALPTGPNFPLLLLLQFSLQAEL